MGDSTLQNVNIRWQECWLSIKAVQPKVKTDPKTLNQTTRNFPTGNNLTLASSLAIQPFLPSLLYLKVQLLDTVHDTMGGKDYLGSRLFRFHVQSLQCATHCASLLLGNSFVTSSPVQDGCHLSSNHTQCIKLPYFLKVFDFSLTFSVNWSRYPRLALG